jgi:hypothetical protein
MSKNSALNGSKEEIDSEVERIASLKAIQTIQGAIAAAGNFSPMGGGSQADASLDKIEA